jgi:hypothetical protein
MIRHGTPRWLLAPALAVLALGAASGARAQSYAIVGAERYFRVEAEPDRSKGRPRLSGYVHNTYGHPAQFVRLLVEGLDGAGQVVESNIAYVPGVVPQFGRTYFEAPVSGSAATYRAKVLSWDWLGRGT